MSPMLGTGVKLMESHMSLLLRISTFLNIVDHAGHRRLHQHFQIVLKFNVKHSFQMSTLLHKWLYHVRRMMMGVMEAKHSQLSSIFMIMVSLMKHAQYTEQEDMITDMDVLHRPYARIVALINHAFYLINTMFMELKNLEELKGNKL